MLGAFLAALSAAIFAFNTASARRGVLTGSVSQALAITVPIGVPLFLLAALVTGSFGSSAALSTQSVGLLALAGVLHFVVGRYGNFRAAQAIGTILSAPILQLSLAVTLALAVLVLKEPLTPLRILGIALLVCGPALLRTVEAPSADISTMPAGISPFAPRYAEGYAFALMAAVVYGVTPLLVRTAVIGGDPRSGIVGGLISYSAATAVVVLVLVLPGQLRHALAITPESAKWFTFSGISICIAQMFIYMAYAVAPVSVVTPILQLHLAFRFFFARLLNPQHEIFGGKMIIATVLALVGALVLSLDPEFLLSLVSVPESVAGFLAWHWP